MSIQKAGPVGKIRFDPLVYTFLAGACACVQAGALWQFTLTDGIKKQYVKTEKTKLPKTKDFHFTLYIFSLVNLHSLYLTDQCLEATGVKFLYSHGAAKHQ